MGFFSPNDGPFVRQVTLTLLVTAIGLAVVFFLFAYLFEWLTALIEIGVIVFILVIAIASASEPGNVFVPLIVVKLLVALFVLARLYNSWERSLIATGVEVLILLISAWVISRIWQRS